jgi:hypothetical protein
MEVLPDVVLKGLVAFWTGDGHARDAVGEHHGQFVGVAAYAPGVIGKAFRFGADGYVSVPNHSALQITGSQTMTLWICPDRTDVRQVLVNKSYGGEGTLALNAAGRVFYCYGTAGRDAPPHCNVGLPADKALKVGQWTHLVAVRDLKARKLRLYINGRLVAEREAKYPAAKASAAPLLLGHGYCGRFHGRIDEVGIWNRALSAAEIAQLAAVAEAEDLRAETTAGAPSTISGL